jgi:membrane-bound serine protease (ClpP class)
MDIHPKFKIIGTVVLFAVTAGLALFMLGRVTAGASLGSWLLGTAVGLLILAAIGVAVVRHLPVSKQFDGILLRDAQASEDGYIAAPTRTDLVGLEGIAITELRPVGTAEIAGERVDVVTDGEFVHKGTPVKVVRADNMKVVVRPAPAAHA